MRAASVPTLEGKTIVVTGSGRGLGRAIATRLGDDGAVVILAERDRQRGLEAESALRATGVDARFVETDISDEASVSALADSLSADGLYGLVNNAALADAVGGKRFDEISVEEWDRIMSVNARGPWLVARALVPLMCRASEGRIVNMASDAALYGSSRLAHYIASKGAVMALTRAMARDVGPEGVTVNAVAPGLVEGESTVDVPAERHELYARNRALTRPQRPDDVVGAVAFLLSDEARYITGHTLVVDGGFVMT